MYIYIYLLVVSTPLKNMKVSWDYSSQSMENKNDPNHHHIFEFNIANSPFHG